METGYITTVNSNSHDAASKMIGDVYTQIYRRDDQSIIKTHFGIAACAIAGNCIGPSDPDKPAVPMAGSKRLTNWKI